MKAPGQLCKKIRFERFLGVFIHEHELNWDFSNIKLKTRNTTDTNTIFGIKSFKILQLSTENWPIHLNSSNENDPIVLLFHIKRILV